MAHITYGIATTLISVTQPRRRGLFRRFFTALMEARMRAAQREINRYRHLLPNELERAATRVNDRTEDGLPFIR